jgi:hypothetical protein
MPEVVTHRYDPVRGACRNLCALPDGEAEFILDQLRRTTRPRLKAGYLARRRATETWLSQEASIALRRSLETPPIYFFLGDFSYFADLSRPAALVLPLTTLPQEAMTFTLGDSMSVAESRTPRLYKLQDVLALFADGAAVSNFGFSDKSGFQTRFIEMQLWERSLTPAHV